MNGLYPNALQVLVTQPLNMPDGSVQLVTLQEGWWKCLDWLIKYDGESLEYVIKSSWEHFLEHPENNFSDIFEHTICVLTALEAQRTFGVANDNLLGSVPDWKARVKHKLAKKFSFLPG